MSVIMPSNIVQKDNVSYITNDNKYDFSRIHPADIKTINEVLQVAYSTKYKENERSIGIINETYPIKYLPRYVLYEIVIMKYALSKKPIDLLSVAIAYESKGSQYADKAKYYYEQYIQFRGKTDMKTASHCYFMANEPYFSHHVSLVYECNAEIEKAIKYAIVAEKNNTNHAPGFPLHLIKLYKKSNIDCCISYIQSLLRNKNYKGIKKTLSEELEDAINKKNKGYVYKTRRRSSKDINSDYMLQALAKRFI